MQRLFGPGTDWALPWMPRVLPRIVRLCELGPERTIFTRFIPAQRPGEGQGTWRRYYQHWASMTLEAVGAEMVELMPELARYVPPATTIDKPVYSPWWAPDLHQRLRARDCDTLVVSGGETDMCVLATVLGAVDLGYRAFWCRTRSAAAPTKATIPCSSSSATAMAGTSRSARPRRWPSCGALDAE